MTVIADRTPAIFLHIGPMKTGTSYLQHLMSDNQEALRSQGVLFPGRNPRVEQVRGVRDVMKLHSEDETPEKFQGAWARLRTEMLEFEGQASVVSQEFMSFARTRRARAIVRSLTPAKVHVVLTVRDTSRALPSAWATATRNRSTSSWQEYVDVLRAGPKKAGGVKWRRSMRAVDVPRMLKDWGKQVSPDRLHVVIVPPPGAPHTVLWERFASVLGVDPRQVDSGSGRRGASYGYHSADFMRRVNAHLQQVPRPAYHRMKRYLLDEVLEKRTGEPKVPITSQVIEFADKWNAVTIDVIRSSGARVHGDLADLRTASPAAVGQAEPPSTEELLRVAADALSGLRHQMHTKYQHVEGAADAPVTPQRWAGERDPVAAAVREVAAAMCKSEDLRTRRDKQRPGSVAAPASEQVLEQ